MKTIRIFISCLLIVFSNIVVAQDFPTRGEIYDYDLGDVFHKSIIHQEGVPNQYGTETTLKNLLVLDKCFSSNQDTLYYTYLVQKHVFNDWNTQQEYSEYEQTVSITNLDDIFIGDTVYEDPIHYNGRVTVYSISYNSNGNASQIRSKENAIGLGEAYYFYQDRDGAPTYYKYENTSRIVYYKKGNEEWGDEQVILGLDENIKSNDFNIYPNPVQNQLNMSSRLNQEIEVQIYNSLGQLMDKITNSSSPLAIDVQHYLCGIYTVHIVDNEGINIEKRTFIKN